VLTITTWRRAVLAAGTLGMLVLAACSSPAPTAPPDVGVGAPGGLVARISSVDLGRVPFDVPAEGRFELVNTSARAVKLTSAPQVKMLEGC
jgi:hypothetical protein